MELRLRLSLLARMAVAAGILLSLSAVLAVVVAVFGVLIGITLLGFLVMPLEFAFGLPRLSVTLGVSPWILAVGALVVLGATFWSTRHVVALSSADHLIPPSDLLSVGYLLVVLVALYELVVEVGAGLYVVVTNALDNEWVALGIVAVAIVVSLWAFVVGLRSEVRALEERTLALSNATRYSDVDLSGLVGRLARHASVPEPTVLVSPHDHPTAFTVGSGATAKVVVSVGLVDLLPDDELEAVLAHEISHLANGDSRVMAAALAPVVFAEDMVDDSPDDIGDWVFWVVEMLLLRYGQFGAAILSRGREWAADSGAAALTGSPAALASALARLDDERGVPSEDLREWSEAFVALDVLPTLSPHGTEWPFRTHPSTKERIARLQRLEAKQERR